MTAGAAGPGHDCPVCGRSGVPGDVDRETGHLWLRRHKKPDNRQWCSSKRRVDAGVASAELRAAYLAGQPSASEVLDNAFVDGATVDDPVLTARSKTFVEAMNGRGPESLGLGKKTSRRAMRRALDRGIRRGDRGLS